MGIFSKPKVPKPVDMWKPNKKTGLNIPAQQATGLIDYYGQYVPKFIGLQEELGAQLIGQHFGQAGEYLGGFGNLARQGIGTAADLIGGAREAELGQMTSQTPLTRGLFEALSPEAAAQVQAATRAAEQAYQRAEQRQLSPQEQRDVTQQTREAFGQRGMLGSTGSVASEILNRDVYRRGVQQEARQEAAQAGARAFQLGQGFYGQPGMNLLSQTPLSYQSGMNLSGAATVGGEAAGGEFDYNMPIGLAKERTGALDQYNMAKYQADAQRYSSMMGMVGNLAGAALIPFTGGLSAGLGLTGMAGGAAGATGFGGMGLSAGMGLSNLFGGIPRAIPV